LTALAAWGVRVGAPDGDFALAHLPGCLSSGGCTATVDRSGMSVRLTVRAAPDDTGGPNDIVHHASVVVRRA
jgi:hypothetical protein